MFNVIDQIQLIVPGAMLIFARLSGMLATMPIFSYPMISGRLRVLTALLFTMILIPEYGALSEVSKRRRLPDMEETDGEIQV